MLNLNKFQSFRLRCFIVVIFITIIQVTVYLIPGLRRNNEGTTKNNSISTKSSPDVVAHTSHHSPLEKKDQSIPTALFNHTNPFEKHWCPNAKCFNSPNCAPCNQRFLFIIATGRSGSTTLMKMLNQLPNVRLSGENYNILYEASKLYSFFDHKDRKKNFVKKDTREKGVFMHETVKEGAFKHNAMPIGSMACVTQKLLRTINPPNFLDVSSSPVHHGEAESKKIIGAKLIRIHNGSWSSMESVQFFKENFPCARFIVNIRSNVENQIKSMSSAFKIEEERREEKKWYLERHNEFLKSFQSLMGDESARLVDLSQWKNDTSIINDVVEWLGFEKCAFRSLLHENHDGYKHDLTTDTGLGDDCRLAH